MLVYHPAKFDRWRAFEIGEKGINTCLILLRKSVCRHSLSHRDIKTSAFLAFITLFGYYKKCCAARFLPIKLYVRSALSQKRPTRLNQVTTDQCQFYRHCPKYANV